jgi:hypothetical protein
MVRKTIVPLSCCQLLPWPCLLQYSLGAVTTAHKGDLGMAPTVPPMMDIAPTRTAATVSATV